MSSAPKYLNENCSISAYTRLGPKSYEALNAYCKANDKSISQTLRWALAEAGIIPR